jgi:hypothetical protein
MLSHNNVIQHISILDTTLADTISDTFISNTAISDTFISNTAISDSFISNISTSNTSISKFICNSCNKIFNTNSHLTQHKNKKNPCFNIKLITNTIEENNSLTIINDKPFNDFMVKYQELIKQNISINNIICEYQTKNKELTSENLKYKFIIKSILQIINQKKDFTLEIDNLDVDEDIILPLKKYN